jgi:hypothetical protein
MFKSLMWKNVLIDVVLNKLHYSWQYIPYSFLLQERGKFWRSSFLTLCKSYTFPHVKLSATQIKSLSMIHIQFYVQEL